MKEIEKDEEIDLNFESSEYNFTINSALIPYEYIGTTRLANISANDRVLLSKISYSIEDGIKGFVEIDSLNGNLIADEKLFQDSYEQIRFSVFAHYKNQLKVKNFF